ncbi:Ras-related protein RABC2a [Capsicum baccatum]|uniref:Ras-related protein RABC2a n=1 Tax=Capsicum baccatum TaxID=33114 RepID=A0A2G2XQ15_CAPBA|nr:Ras-related protein RABC2a [Capsicum baccatum]
MLVGNKVDREFERAVTREEVIALEKKLGGLFLECSAKTRENVQNCFEEIALKTYSILMSDESQKGLNTAIKILGISPAMPTRNYEATILYSSSPNNVQKFNKNHFIGHTTDNCYKIVEYPNNRLKKKDGGFNYDTGSSQVSIGGSHQCLKIGTYQSRASVDTRNIIKSKDVVYDQVHSSSSTVLLISQMLMLCFFTNDKYDHIVQVLSSRFDSDSSGTLFYILCRGESSCFEDVMSDVGFMELFTFDN